MTLRLVLLAFALMSTWAPGPTSAGSRGPLDAPAEPTVLKSGRDARWVETGFDPISVFYPPGACDSSFIEIELWSRELEAWIPHPRHPRMSTGGCTVEDAGKLLNEIRVRCADPEGRRPASAWRVGAEVWHPLDASACPVAAGDRGPLRVSILSPGPGDDVRAERGFAKLSGRVELEANDSDLDDPHPAGNHAVDRLRIDNLSTGEFSEDVILEADGHFTGRAPVSAGPNHLRVSVVSGDGRFGSADVEIEFRLPDDHERVLAGERRRIRRAREARRKAVELHVEPETPPAD